MGACQCADEGGGFNMRATGGSHERIPSGYEVRRGWKDREMGLCKL